MLAVAAHRRHDHGPGHFEAIAATWSVDRQNEQIVKGAFAQTIKNWQGSRKSVPVHWDHRGEAENVIGSVARPR